MLFSAAFALTNSLPAEAQQSAPPTPVVFDHVTVIDVKQGKHIPNQRVVVVGNRIQASGDTSTTQTPKGARIVDARSKYLIPGLWDMHVHVWSHPQIFYPLFVANGVTGIREMSQILPFDSLLLWRHQIESGLRVGPRVLGTGGYLASKGTPPLMIAVPTPDDARRVVDSLKQIGADLIKVRGGLSRDVYFAAAAEARRIGIPLVGHLPDSVTVEEASDSGQRTIEHSSLVRQCAESDSVPASAATCGALVERLQRNGTWITPTFATFSFGMLDRLNHGPDRMHYWPAAVRQEATSGFVSVWRTTVARDAEQILQRMMAGMRGIKRFGTPFLAGTDGFVTVWEVTPGFSLHDELAFMVQGGLTPLEALQAATLNPAKLLNATDSLGTVETGKVADLVLLDADPLADIHNTTTIRAVVANGRYYDRTALDQILAKVRAEAQ